MKQKVIGAGDDTIVIPDPDGQEGKVLGVASGGNPEWQTPSGGSVPDQSVTGAKLKTTGAGDPLGSPTVTMFIVVSGGIDKQRTITLGLERATIVDAWIILLDAGTTGSTVKISIDGVDLTDTLNVSATPANTLKHFNLIDIGQMFPISGSTLQANTHSTDGDFPGAYFFMSVLCG